ncbi:glycosidase-like protein [Hapsidospora chrysogenum ATCC 11550]|uniref:chitinase n=1 Tax=Hapsidospora chrysogenum (strain ATCC 11550 / CBS 779.69 / DSM 880 / IAM 14645 / JCM 23072 / IMI 49137) TaxID=857340 RepID=A0A086T899_HAPC1|nr:glycosidase-like protein [Hapsidospora chrysogenum ATCC 11550]
MLWRRFLSAVALLGVASAQVNSDCDPTEGHKCKPNPALGTSHSWHFNSTPNGQLWETLVGPIHYNEDDGAAKFTIDEQGDSPTLRSKFYIFFGRVEFSLKASKGRGIVSSMMLLSDDLDEIDWEFIGTNASATTNFYGKGIEDYTNGEWHDVPVPVQDDYHNYTIVWTKDKIDFYIDENQVRRVEAKDSKSNDTDIFPQTPMRMSLGIWAGGDPSLHEGTREWAGGDTDFDAGPYDMYVKSVNIEDYSSGKEYIWGDESGSWESIEIVEGNSTAYEIIHQKPEKTLNDKFNDLPQAAKIAIYAGGAAVAAAILAGLIFYCIKQRRRGAQEARTALQHSEAERMELNKFKKSGIDPDGFTEHGAEYNAREMKAGGMADGDSYNVPGASEKPWGTAAAIGAGAGAGAAGAAALRSYSQSPGPGSYHDLRGPGSPGPGSYHDLRSPGSPGPAAYHDMRSPGSPGPGAYHDMRGPGSPVHGRFPTPPVGPLRSPSLGADGSQSPLMRSPGSPGPQQAYGAHRMQQQNFSDARDYGMDRIGSPGPHGYR